MTVTSNYYLFQGGCSWALVPWDVVLLVSPMLWPGVRFRAIDSCKVQNF